MIEPISKFVSLLRKVPKHLVSNDLVPSFPCSKAHTSINICPECLVTLINSLMACLRC